MVWKTKNMNYVAGLLHVMMSIGALVSMTVLAATMGMAVIIGADKLMDAKYVCRIFGRCATPNQ